MKLIRVGVDLAKNVFQLHGVDRSEKTVWRRKLVRGDWIKALLDRIESDCEIGMEACSGTHHWGPPAASKRIHGQADRSAVR